MKRYLKTSRKAPLLQKRKKKSNVREETPGSDAQRRVVVSGHPDRDLWVKP